MIQQTDGIVGLNTAEESCFLSGFVYPFRCDIPCILFNSVVIKGSGPIAWVQMTACHEN